MTFDDRIDKAKREKALLGTPTLRRLIVYSRWMASFGGIAMLIGAARNLPDGSSLTEDSPLPLLLSLFGLVYAAVLMGLSFRIKEAADQQNVVKLRDVLGRLRVLLVVSVFLCLGMLLYVLAVVDGHKSGPPPGLWILIIMAPQFLSVFFLVRWIVHVRKAEAEIATLPE